MALGKSSSINPQPQTNDPFFSGQQHEREITPPPSPVTGLVQHPPPLVTRQGRSLDKGGGALFFKLIASGILLEKGSKKKNFQILDHIKSKGHAIAQAEVAQPETQALQSPEKNTAVIIHMKSVSSPTQTFSWCKPQFA